MSIRFHDKRRTRRDQKYIDVTSKSDDPIYIKFSPFYPHGNIPVPGSANLKTESVEGAWQGLKVLDNGKGFDLSKLTITDMKRLKRPQKYNVLGHRYDQRLLPYVDARKLIYIPMYEFVLTTYLLDEVTNLVKMVRDGKNIILLDYETNCDINNINKPLSHASLIVSHVMRMIADK